jgi:hypothetical protein
MAEVCALDKGVQEAPSTRVVLDETRAVVNLGRDCNEGVERWYLDIGASTT